VACNYLLVAHIFIQKSGNPQLKERLDQAIQDAQYKLEDMRAKPVMDASYYNKKVNVPLEPIFVKCSEGLGTVRARASHLDPIIHQAQEMEALNAANAPIPLEKKYYTQSYLKYYKDNTTF
jgi:hypothetical protein